MTSTSMSPARVLPAEKVRMSRRLEVAGIVAVIALLRGRRRRNCNVRKAT